MWTRKKITKVVAVVLFVWILLVCARILLSTLDYDRVDLGGEPIFAMCVTHVKDGGTRIYQGLGYSLTRQCSFHMENERPDGYDYGPVLEYQMNWFFLPLNDISHVRPVSLKPTYDKILGVTKQTQCPLSKIQWDVNLDQPIEQLEEVLSTLEQQQPMNYTVANIAFLYDGKLYILFDKYIQALPENLRTKELEEQKQWLLQRDKETDEAYREYEGGTLASFVGGKAHIKSTKERIKIIEQKMKPYAKSSRQAQTKTTSPANDSSDSKRGLNIKNGLPFQEVNQALLSYGAQDWTAGCSYAVDVIATDEPVYDWKYRYYALPNDMLITIGFRSKDKMLQKSPEWANSDINQFVVGHMKMSNSRMLRRDKIEVDYSIDAICQTDSGETELNFTPTKESIPFIYKGMLKIKADTLLKRNSVKVETIDEKELEKLIDDLNEQRKKLGFPAKGTITMNKRWFNYQTQNGEDFYIQYDDNDDDIVSLINTIVYVSPNPIKGVGGRSFPLIEFEVANLLKIESLRNRISQ